MDPLLTNDERKMQEKILQHEFPFDEKAWASMESLLDEEKKKLPIGIAPTPIGHMPGPSRKWGLLTILLFVFVTVSATLLLWRSDWRGKTTASGTLSSPILLQDSAGLNATMGGTSSQQDGKEHLQLENPDVISSANRLTTTLSEPEIRKTAQKEAVSKGEGLKKANDANTRPTEKSQAINTKPYLDNSKVPIRTPLLNVPFPKEEPVSSSDKSATTFDASIELPLAKDSVRQGVSADISSQNLAELGQIPLPFPPVKHAKQEPYFTTQPVNERSILKRRLEQGWIFGLNANIVDYHPLRLSTFPHVGYFASVQLRPGTSVQGEIVAKWVSDYQLHAEFWDIVPGGSTHIIHNTNNLFFIEMPLLLKRSYRPGQSYLVGVKPAGIIAVAPTGSVAIFNDGPTRLFDSQGGIRYFDFGLLLGWEWRFGRKWAVDVRYNQGLLDLSFDQFFRNTQTHLNSDLQLSLRYFIGK